MGSKALLDVKWSLFCVNLYQDEVVVVRADLLDGVGQGVGVAGAGGVGGLVVVGDAALARDVAQCVVDDIVVVGVYGGGGMFSAAAVLQFYWWRRFPQLGGRLVAEERYEIRICFARHVFCFACMEQRQKQWRGAPGCRCRRPKSNARSPTPTHF